MISRGLISEFKDSLNLPGFDENDRRFQHPSTYGTAYLVVNVTDGTPEEWRSVAEQAPRSTPFFNKNGEWIDLIYSNGHLVLSATLCYAAFDTADIPVEISGNQNRTEPQPTFDHKTERYKFTEYRHQLGQNTGSLSRAQRQTLELKKGRWIANASEVPPVQAYVRNAAEMSRTGAQPRDIGGNNGNTNAILWQASLSSFNISSDGRIINPDVMHKHLFQDIVQNGGSSAFALQSLITLFSGMTYYDQIAQFDNFDNVSRADFVIANIPSHHRGFYAVLIFVILQLILIIVVLITYMAETRFSQMGNTWLNLAQAVTPETCQYLDMTTIATEEEVEKVMEKDGVLKRRVRLEQQRDDDGTEVRVSAVMVGGYEAGMVDDGYGNDVSMRKRGQAGTFDERY